MKIIYFFVLFTLGTATTFACDMCGCAGSSNYLGIIPLVQSNFVGYRFNYLNFNHPQTEKNTNGSSQVLRDQFFQNEAWIRLYPNKRWQIFGFVPYKTNVRTESMRTTIISGLGDVMAMANYAILLPKDLDTSNWKHFLLAGGTLRAPTGKYQQRDESLSMLPPLFQTGTGAWGYGLSAFYTVRYKNVGLNSNALYFINATNELNYKLGNQISTSASAFYWLDLGKTTILPQAGFTYEYFQKDLTYGSPDNYTGGSRLSANIATDVYFGKFLLNAFVQLPITQFVPESQPTFSVRTGLSLSYFFQQKKAKQS